MKIITQIIHAHCFYLDPNRTESLFQRGGIFFISKLLTNFVTTVVCWSKAVTKHKFGIMQTKTETYISVTYELLIIGQIT